MSLTHLFIELSYFHLYLLISYKIEIWIINYRFMYKVLNKIVQIKYNKYIRKIYIYVYL